MSLKPLLSFSSGELDPILTDNVTLEKFNKGLATARNVMVGKTGSILSRFGTYHLVNAKNANETIKIYCPPNSDYVLEFGDLYVRVYYYVDASFETYAPLTLGVELAHALLEADLPNLHFTTSKDNVYIFCAGKETLKLNLNFASSAFVASANVFKVLDPIDAVTVTPVGAPTGYTVDYLATIVVNGEESLYEENITGYAKPIVAGQSNTIGVKWTTTDVDINQFNEVRIYSRPSGGGAYGFLVSSSRTSIAGADTYCYLSDIGGLPDYTNGVQDLVTKYGMGGLGIIALKGKTGTVYQQRLLTATETDEEAILASRPGYQNNFYRDFPYAADSALQFKAGTSGKANVLRMIESDGLVVFTTNGVYTSSGLLSVNNLAMERRGNWVIKDTIAPLVIPGGLFFVDTSNTIRQLVFSQQILAYETLEQTIFSNHLFKNRTIKTWAYQDGLTPLIIVTFSDGDWATFTFNAEHQMRAWTRHDSKYPIDQVEGTEKSDRTFFVFNKDGQRSIGVNIPRRAPVDVIVSNTEYDKLVYFAFMDNIESITSTILLSNILVPVVSGDWAGELTWTQGDSLPDLTVGEIFRWFNPTDRSVIDLEVTAVVTAGLTYTVQPSETFPSAYASTDRIYYTFGTVSNLNHLEGEEVSVMVDGFIVSSPYNDVEGYSTLTVTGGAITLPDSLRGAIIHVGRPIVADVKTLNMSTIEQSPTLIESLNVNKLYIRVNETRGLYCSNEFPEEDNDEVDGHSVIGMESLDEALVPQNGLLIGNRYIPAVSRRLEKSIPGGWDSQGRISMRQVDPFHFEILSIIPDVEILKRSDR